MKEHTPLYHVSEKSWLTVVDAKEDSSSEEEFTDSGSEEDADSDEDDDDDSDGEEGKGEQAVKGGKMQNTLADGTVNEMEIPDGFASHGDKLVKHQMMNIGEEMVKVLLVEHKKLEIAKL